MGELDSDSLEILGEYASIYPRFDAVKLRFESANEGDLRDDLPENEPDRDSQESASSVCSGTNHFAYIPEIDGMDNFENWLKKLDPRKLTAWVSIVSKF